MDKKYLVIILSFSFFLVLLAQSADARTMEYVNSIIYPPVTFQIFEDGVTYTEECMKKDHIYPGAVIGGYKCGIIHEGVKYPCEFKRMHGGVLTPMCVEIILKTMENNN